MNRVSGYQRDPPTQALSEPANGQVPLYLRLRDPITGLNPAIAELVQNIRTDLDRFSPLEIQLLVYAGYAAAFRLDNFTTNAPPGISFTPNNVPFVAADFQTKVWLPFTQSQLGALKPTKKLRSSSKLSLFSLLRPSFRSPVACAVLVVIAFAARFFFDRTAVPDSPLRFQQFDSISFAGHEASGVDVAFRPYIWNLVNEPGITNTFYLATQQLGKFVRGRDPAAFVCTFSATKPLRRLHVYTFLVNGPPDQRTVEILPPRQMTATSQEIVVPAVNSRAYLVSLIGIEKAPGGEISRNYADTLAVEVQGTWDPIDFLRSFVREIGH